MLLALVAQPAVAADIKAGKKKAQQVCQVCHGLNGIAVMPIAPNIGGESEIYLVKQLKAFRSGERKNEIMDVIAKKLSDEDIADVAAWYGAIEITATIPDLK